MRTQAAPSTTVKRILNRHYVIHGYGGSPAVQARLAQHGLITHVTWDPGPPAWRLHYDTDLPPDELFEYLDDLRGRFEIQIFESV